MKPTKKQLQAYKKQYLLCISLATKLFDNDWNKAVSWMNNPNEIFFNASPVETILTGEGIHLEQWLRGRLGLEGGAAF